MWTALYAALAVAIGMDVHSTRLALRRGAVEANPLLKAVARSTWALGLVLAGVCAFAIWVIDTYVRPTAPTVAGVILAGLAVYRGYIAVKNYRIAARRR